MAKDDNGLPVYYGRLEILVKPKLIRKTFENDFFLPDTLLYTEMPLNREGETELEIPASLFPELNFTYEVEAKMYNSENEMLSDRKEFAYIYHQIESEIKFQNDSLYFEILEKGIAVEGEGEISRSDVFGNTKLIYSGRISYALKPDPSAVKYSINYEGYKKEFSFNEIPSGISLNYAFSKDSLVLNLKNPYALVVRYFIYSGNKKIASGIWPGSRLAMTNDRKDYRVFLSYLWGGIEQSGYYII